MKVLVVDDQQAMRTSLRLLFDLAGLVVIEASSPEEGLSIAQRDDIGVVVHDMNFTAGETSGREGVALFRALRALDPELPIVMITAWASLEQAVTLVKEGAADYVEKPWDDDKLLTTVRNLMRMRVLSDENTQWSVDGALQRRELQRRFDLCGLTYASQAMHTVVALAVQVAAADVPILITGPNGSGKEMIARVVQANSRRKGKPYVAVNAGGLPDELLEAELFGAEAGAFTGAKARVGRFEAADTGTLFLDEIGNLSMSGQMKLLRVLQAGELQRLGSNETRRTDVRVISATNDDLHKAIAGGRFREDLYFRLNVVELRVPGLNERPEDVLLLARHFLSMHGGSRPRRLSREAESALQRHDWRGNVRELQNRVQRAVIVATSEEIGIVDLDLQEPTSLPMLPSPARPLDRELLLSTLSRTGGNISRAASELGLSRQALYRRIEKLGIEIERNA
jgi:DNA-binding NtrC family response regulator